MITPFHEELEDGRTMQDLSLWPTSLIIVGILLLAAAPAVSGQRGFGITGDTSPFKGYSGIRARADAKRVVYFHDQTIAVVEVGDHRELYNCELIEVYKPIERKMLLQNLTQIAKTFQVTFEEMMTLMSLCGQLSSPVEDNQPGVETRRALPNINPVTLLSGILPGTKWCGAGDLARNYYDLGAEANLDKCCRAHDLCPVKIRAYSSRYNLTNNSLYTKSHCSCDALLRQCLKEADSPRGDIMGNIYFNLLKVPCVRQSKDRTIFQSATQYV